MSRSYLNLAREPYVNSRPVVRLALVLWVIGALLLAGNVWLYWDFLAGRGDTHARLRTVGGEIDAAEERLAQLDRRLAQLDLQEQNRQVAYLNERIERRHFSWSELFDELAEILPDDVRLTSLSPASADEGGRGRSRSGVELGEDEVLLTIDAQAKDDEPILRMVDALFSDPAFRRPDLQSQRREQGGLIQFDLEVIYRPERPAVIMPSGGGQPRPSGGGQPRPSGGARPGLPSDGTTEPASLGAAASSPPELR